MIKVVDRSLRPLSSRGSLLSGGRLKLCARRFGCGFGSLGGGRLGSVFGSRGLVYAVRGCGCGRSRGRGLDDGRLCRGGRRLRVGRKHNDRSRSRQD